MSKALPRLLWTNLGSPVSSALCSSAWSFADCRITGLKVVAIDLSVTFAPSPKTSPPLSFPFTLDYFLFRAPWSPYHFPCTFLAAALSSTGDSAQLKPHLSMASLPVRPSSPPRPHSLSFFLNAEQPGELGTRSGGVRRACFRHYHRPLPPTMPFATLHHLPRHQRHLRRHPEPPAGRCYHWPLLRIHQGDRFAPSQLRLAVKTRASRGFVAQLAEGSNRADARVQAPWHRVEQSMVSFPSSLRDS
jgi:hypothetical protein